MIQSLLNEINAHKQSIENLKKSVYSVELVCYGDDIFEGKVPSKIVVCEYIDASNELNSDDVILLSNDLEVLKDFCIEHSKKETYNYNYNKRLETGFCIMKNDVEIFRKYWDYKQEKYIFTTI